MKNYYDQLHELKIAKLRLKTLKEKRILYFEATQPGAVNYNGERVNGGIVKNSFENYVEKIEDIDEKIKVIEAEIIILTEHIKEMEKALREIKDPLVIIFVSIYIDGLSINQTCKKTNYSRSQIYRKLKTIRKILKDETK